jgi:tRNA (guanine37-N1)-methyltransferase
MRFDVFTLFPAMFVSPFAESILQRAAQSRLIEIHTHNVRDYTTDKHHVTDDYAYGGGGGMVMKPEPIFKAVESVMRLSGGESRSEQGTIRFVERGASAHTPIILMSPAGRTFTHSVAVELAQFTRVAFVCGHYEGVDERVRDYLCTDAISIGDYVLTGGELPAMVMMDAISRQIEGVLPEFAPRNESHVDGSLEYPHYTRPSDFRGWRVPDVLLSGDHAAVERWRREQSSLRTRERNS